MDPVDEVKCRNKEVERGVAIGRLGLEPREIATELPECGSRRGRVIPREFIDAP